jgi:hypothetical protein
MKAFAGVCGWINLTGISGLWLGLSIVSTMWLSQWVADSYNHSSLFYANIYTALVCAICVTVLFRSISIAIGSVKASNVLHKQMLRSLLGAKMTFFDTELTVSFKWYSRLNRRDVFQIGLLKTCHQLMKRYGVCSGF